MASFLDFIRRKGSDNKTPLLSSTSVAGKNSRAHITLDLEQISREVHQIEDLLKMLGDDDEEMTTSSPVTSVALKLQDVFQILPRAFRCATLPLSQQEISISIVIDNLFEQLAQGNVTTTIQRLVQEAPHELLSAYAEEHKDDVAPLPLPLLIASIPSSDLTKRISAKYIDRGEKNLPDLFVPESDKPHVAVATPVEERVTPEIPHPLPPPAPLSPAEGHTPTDPLPVAEEKSVVSEPTQATPPPDENMVLILRGVNINDAPVETLVNRLDGVGSKLANQIVAERTVNGPFKDLYDLMRVPGLRPSTFVKITGVPWPALYSKYKTSVDHIVQGSDKSSPNVRDVAQRFKEAMFFDACIIIHHDGFVLAGNANAELSNGLAAFTPQIFKKVVHYVKQLDMGETRSVVFFMDEKVIMLAHYGLIYVAALLEPNQFNRKYLEMVQAVTFALGRYFSK